MIIFDKKLVKIHKKRNIKYIIDDNYDDFLVKIVYDDLLERINFFDRNFKNILEIGVKKDFLFRKFPKAKIFNTSEINYFPVDRYNIIVDNESLCFRENYFDLVLNVLDFHRVNDLVGLLIQLNKILKDSGLLIVSLYSSGTLKELRDSLIEAALELDLSISARIFPFVKCEDLTLIAKRAKYKNIIIDNYNITSSYNSVIDLMHDIRKMGQSNSLLNKDNLPLSRVLINKLEEIYKRKYSLADGTIKASFNISTITASK